MRVFKNKAFARFADRNDISDEDLCDAVQRASRGLIDADLGGALSTSVSRARARASRVASAR